MHIFILKVQWLHREHLLIAVVKHGTTGVVSDPHEIANVLGMRGVNL